ncbi:hypothetical protein [Caulobacter segnis]
MENSAEKRPGRPKKTDDYVGLKLRIPRTQADYLVFLGKRFGWGCEINEVVRALLIKEVMRFQEANYHDKALPEAD